MITFRIASKQGDFLLREFKSAEGCNNFIVNHMDLSRQWNFEAAHIQAAFVYIPKDVAIDDYGYASQRDFAKLLRKYKTNPTAVQFLANILE